MQKIVLAIITIIIAVLVINKQQGEVIIPNEAVRLRIIPNSNDKTDLLYKELVKEKTEQQINNIIKNASSLEEVRYLLNNKLDGIEAVIEEVVEVNDIKQTIDINYGLNYFPEKEYKGTIYKEGYYESIVVTLGEGTGDNWWCVLFPPLCLLEQDKENKEEQDYRFYIKDIIEQFVS